MDFESKVNWQITVDYCLILKITRMVHCEFPCVDPGQVLSTVGGHGSRCRARVHGGGIGQGEAR